MGAEAESEEARRGPVQVIFDSDVLIWVFRRDPLAIRFFEADRAPMASVVTLMELFAGAKTKAELMTTRGFFVEFGIELIPVTAPVSYAAASLVESHCLGDGLDIADAMIAATARELGETLATANFRYFRKIPNLAIHPFRPSRRS